MRTINSRLETLEDALIKDEEGIYIIKEWLLCITGGIPLLFISFSYPMGKLTRSNSAYLVYVILVKAKVTSVEGFLGKIVKPCYPLELLGIGLAQLRYPSVAW